uniref:Fibronectin type-III domain-containing protein n=1 Tax=Heterorhabditis bacteriophora TaxID=37862 RepID=A0A1I7WV89_HETBA
MGLIPFLSVCLLCIVLNGLCETTQKDCSYNNNNNNNNTVLPSAPLNFEVVLISSNQVRLTWDPPLHSNGILAGYNVFSEKLLNGVPVRDRLQKIRVIKDNQSDKDVNLQKRYTEIDKLEPNTEYALRMTAFNYKGDGEFTESKTFITGGIRGFNLWYKPEGAQEYKKKVVNGTENSVELTGLCWFFYLFYTYILLDAISIVIYNNYVKCSGMGRVYEIVLGAENVEGLSVNATEKLLTPVGNPEGEPLNVQYEVVNGKVEVRYNTVICFLPNIKVILSLNKIVKQYIYIYIYMCALLAEQLHHDNKVLCGSH